MSETASSPSVHVHSISSSSSFSSADSGPHSEPTSDEQPDLGAFTTVLREWTHLQPPPRIPVQIHSATSSTTSTYQPEQSTIGSDMYSRTQRSRNFSERTGPSRISSFTRPPSSSAQPEGSTVWNHAPIASYLYSQTPSNDIEEEDEDASRNDLATPSSPNSALTIEIASEVDFPSVNGSSEHLAEQVIELPVPVGSDGQRLDSRETAHQEDLEETGGSSSLTSRDYVRPYSDSALSTSRPDSESLHLQSQAGAPTNTSAASSSDSLFIPPLPSTVATAIPTSSSQSLQSNNPHVAHSSSTSTSTATTAFLRPITSRTVSDSSYATNTSASSSDLSLLSQRIPESPPESDQEREPITAIRVPGSFGSLEPPHPSTYLPSTHSPPQDALLPTERLLQPSGVSQISSILSNASPLPNPYSPSPSHPPELIMPTNAISHHGPVGQVNPSHQDWHPSELLRDVVNDYTPDRTPSETISAEPRRRSREFVPVNDDEIDIVGPPAYGSGYPKDAGSNSVEAQYVADARAGNAIAGPSSQRIAYPTPHIEEDEAEEQNEDSSYSYQYPIAHTPRTYAQAMTPRGPPLQTESRSTQFDLSSRLPGNDYIMQPGASQQAPRLQPESRPRPSIMTQSSSAPQAPAADLYSRHSYYYPNTQNTTTSTIPTDISTPSTFTDPPAMQIHHAYPHSLLGLHALPASLVSPGPEEVPGFDFTVEQSSSRNNASFTEHEPIIESDTTSDASNTENIVDPELPSLGYLDEALRFIVAERERWSALRDAPAQRTVDTSAEDRDSAVGSGDDIEGGEGEVEWRRLGDEKDQEPEQTVTKRRRRRKRPSRAHPPSMLSTGAEQEQFSSSVGESISVGASPKKSRRSKVSSSTATSLEGKMTARPPEKPFLVPPPVTPSVVTILRRPVEIKSQSSTQGDSAFDSENDGGKTPTNGAEGVAGASMTIHVRESSPPNLTGKKGKRVGRREREREKLKKDMQKEMSKEGGSEEEDSEEDEIGVNFDYVDELDAEDDSPLEESVEDQEDQGENDSISNLPLLRPPRRRHVRRRRRAADTVYIHSVFGMEQGAYKSIPASPKRLELDLEDVGEESRDFSIGNVPVDKPKAQDDSEIFDARPSGRVVGEKKKRTRSRRLRSLSHAKSDPQLRQDSTSTTEAGKPVDDLEITASIKARKDQKAAAQQDDDIDILDLDRTQFQKLISASSATGSRVLLLNQQLKSETPAQQTSSNTKRGRIIALARKLVQLFPEQQEELGKVITRLERQYPKQKTRGDELSNAGGVPQQQSPSTAPGLKRKKSKKKSGHARTASEGTGGEGMEYEDDSIDSGVGGFLRNMHRQPAEHDDDDEEEIDPRGRPPKKGDVLIHVFIDHSNILIGLLSHLKRHPPQRKLAGKSHHLLTGPTAKSSTSVTSNATQEQASTFSVVKPTRSRPLTIPTKSEAVSSRSPQTHNADTEGGSHPIALPSFATPSRSLPAAPGLASYMPRREDSQSPDIQRHKDVDSDGNDYADESADIFHPDSLIFGSSHRAKEKRIMKHLWHAALTLILERGRPITRRVVVTSSPLYQPMDTIERLGYELRVFIRVPDFGDGMDRERFRERHSSSKSNSNSGKAAQHIGSGGAFSSPQKGSHVRRISGDYSAESGSGDGSGSGGGGKEFNYSSNTPNAKIKYREQGVDELLQLKLHQALAATDYVPEGSTIVLATGDGNVGQFNEDGFLGPVRTALKRGWRVELYAWEDGLSRSWRREFGAGSEWGRRGMFRVIGMEQFANSLLEASEWST